MPVLSPNLRAARRLMDVGIDLARAGRHLTTTADPRKLRIRDGTLPIAQLTRLEPQLAATEHALDRAAARLAGIERAYLLTSVDDQVSRLERRLTKAVHDSRVAADAARILPAVFGGNGTRRYFLAVQNNAESRATGGFIGNWGLITATNGKLSLDRFEPVRVLNPAPEQTRTLHAPADYVTRYERFQPERRWQNVNASPDLPTVGPIIVDQLRQAGVGPVDGVVTVDPVGLADVLRLTGPVRVAGWPQPITAANVVDVTLRQAYVVFAATAAHAATSSSATSPRRSGGPSRTVISAAPRTCCASSARPPTRSTLRSGWPTRRPSGSCTTPAPMPRCPAAATT